MAARVRIMKMSATAASSLASPWEEFVEDLARIRTEFSWAPEVVFCSIQLQILTNFANDDVRLYRPAETSGKWRVVAMANLKRCTTELQKRIAELSSV
jgi:predicted metal-dependent HD superfamily phosphohydrolase